MQIAICSLLDLAIKKTKTPKGHLTTPRRTSALREMGAHATDSTEHLINILYWRLSTGLFSTHNFPLQTVLQHTKLVHDESKTGRNQIIKSH
jgi:hypothetical protein